MAWHAHTPSGEAIHPVLLSPPLPSSSTIAPTSRAPSSPPPAHRRLSRRPITARVQLLDLVDKSQLLPEYGGTLAYDTQSWIDTCIAAHRTWASEGGEAKAK